MSVKLLVQLVLEIALRFVIKLMLFLIHGFILEIQIMKLFIMIRNRILKLEEIQRLIFYSNNGKFLKYNLMNDTFLLWLIP